MEIIAQSYDVDNKKAIFKLLKIIISEDNFFSRLSDHLDQIHTCELDNRAIKDPKISVP